MKKTILSLLLFVVTLSLFSIEISGDFRTRFSLLNTTNGFSAAVSEPCNKSEQYIDSRIRLRFVARPNEDLTITYRLQVGDLVWGQHSTAGVFSSRQNVRTKNLFAEYRGFENTPAVLC